MALDNTSSNLTYTTGSVSLYECNNTLFKCSNNSIHPLNIHDIDTINDDKVNVLIPVMALFGLVSIVGTVGNCLVCYVFGYIFPKHTQSYLIVQLAVFDLINCVLTVPAEIFDIRFHLNYTLTTLCRTTKMLSYFVTVCSDITLACIALDRFRKICQPFHRQVSFVHVKLMTLAVVGSGVLIVWPTFFMFGKRTTALGDNGATTNTTCAIADHNILTPDLRSIFHKVLFGTVFAVSVLVGISYYFILRTIRMSKNRLQKFKRKPEVQEEQVHVSTITSSESTSTESTNLDMSSTLGTNQKQKSTVEDQRQNMKSISSLKMKMTVNKQESKTAIISFVATVTFMLSFVPMAVVDSIISITQSNPEQLTGIHLVLHTIFIRSVFINSIANPIIYGVMNRKFRNAVYNIFRTA